MACTVLNIANEKKSALHEELIKVLGSEELATKKYAQISGPDFMERFGDWGYNYQNPNSDTLQLTGEIMGNGEPKLFRDSKTGQYFFRNKNGTREYLDRLKFQGMTAQQVEFVTNWILYRFSLERGKRSINNYDGDNPSDSRLMMKAIERGIADYRKQIAGRPDEDLHKQRIDLVEKNKEDFRLEAISIMESRGTKMKELMFDEEGNRLYEVPEEDRTGAINIKESYETNTKDTATAATKSMLSEIPDRETTKDENGNVVFSEEYKDGFLDVPRFAEFNDIWTTLQKLLADEVGYGSGQSVYDIFDVMYNKIKMLESIKPWGAPLIKRLDLLVSTKNFSEINQFVQAFNKTYLNFYVTEYDPVTKKYSVINASSTNSRRKKILNNWNNGFDNIYLNGANLYPDAADYLSEMAVENESLQAEFEEEYALAGNDVELQNEAIQKYGMQAISLLNTLGATIDGTHLWTFIAMNGGMNKGQQTVDQIFNVVGYMLGNINQPNRKFRNENGDLENIFGNENILNAIAEAVAIEQTDISESSVLLNQGKSGFAYSNPTYLSDKLNEWRKDPQSFIDIALDISRKNSQWYKQIMRGTANLHGQEKLDRVSENLKNFELGLDSSFKSRGKNDGVDNTKITLNDNINANISQMLNGKLKNGKSYFPTLVAADKSRRMLFSGIEMFQSGILKDPETSKAYITSDAIDVGVGYFIDEYMRMKDVEREINDPNVQKIVHYHTADKTGLSQGQRSQIFPELDRDNTDPALEEFRMLFYGESIKDSKHKELTPEQILVLRDAIEKSMIDRVGETVTRLESIKGLNQDLLNAYNNDMYALAGDYFMNGLISSVEYTKLFSGDPAYYKNTADLIKRIPATYTDGLKLRLRNGDSLIFNQATVYGVEVPSRYVELIRDSLSEDDKHIADAYDDVNTTDAQAWITPRRWKFLKEALGQWGPLHDSAYKKMLTGKRLNADESKVAAQPLKGVYFEINEGRPVYLKYSQAVLIPSLVKGTPLEAMYNKMVNDPETGEPYSAADGHKEIHEVVTLDGVKVGAVAPTKINVGDTVEVDPNLELNPVVLNNRGWKLQQDLPTKLIKDTDVGSQIQKNIMEGMDIIGNYNYYGEITGKTLVEKIHETVSALSDIGREELSEELGIDINGKISDKSFIYNELITEFKRRGGNENIISALQKEMPLDAIPQLRGRVESMMMSIFNKRLLKIQTKGGSFIQLSPFGLESHGGSEGVKIISKSYDGKGLKPPRIDKKTNTVLPGQALMPRADMLKLLKKNDINIDDFDTIEEAASKLDPSALRIIGYRIPNQGMSSNPYLEVVGILPEGVGDAIIAYDGLPAQTGSDFDIDKMFVMTPHLVFNKKEGKIEKLTSANIRYFEATGSEDLKARKLDKALLQNNLIEAYEAVLSSPHTYPNMMRSIDGQELKDDINYLFPAKKMNNMQLFSPIQQLDTKYEYLAGKFGVAQTANQLVDHVSNQVLFNEKGERVSVGFNGWIGQGNKEDITYLNKKGEEKTKAATFFDTETQGSSSISTVLSQFLNAYVDIAKDPYISRGNHNAYTANVAFMLIRSGVDIKWVNRFIGQPIIKELAELTMNQGAITSDQLEVTNANEDGTETTYRVSPIEQIRKKYGLSDTKVSGKQVSELTKSKLEKVIIDKKNKNIDADPELNDLILNAWEFLHAKAKQFNEGVMAAKSDTQGAGGSNVHRLVNENKIVKVGQDNFLRNYKYKFSNGAGRKTSLGTYSENTLRWVKRVMMNSNLFFSGTKAVEETFNRISEDTGNGKLLTNLDLGKAIDNSFYSYLMSGLDIFSDIQERYDEILSTADRVAAMKLNYANEVNEAIEGAGPMPEINALIDAFEVEERSGRKWIGINNKDKPTFYQNRVYRAWMDLYHSANPDMRKLAVDLVKYSYITSGFQNNLSQFFTHIPHDILRDNDISGNITDMMNKINLVSSDEAFVDQMQRHSKDAKGVVKDAGKKTTYYKLNGLTEYQEVLVGKPPTSELDKLGTSVGNSNKEVFPKFVKKRIDRTYYLYELAGTVKEKNFKNEDVDVPVYGRTYELGLKQGKYKLFEYDMGNNKGKSKIAENNLSSTTASRKMEALAEISRRSDFKAADVYKAEVDKMIKAQQAQEQRLLDSESESLNVAQEKANMMQEKMDVVVIFDENVKTSRVLAKSDKRTKEAGKPVILINPNLLQSDTVFHEFGHVFIDSLPQGFNNKNFQAALQQLRGTELESELRKLYPELSEEDFAKELVTTALGKKADELFKDSKQASKWATFVNWIMDYIKRKLGLERDYVLELAKIMLTQEVANVTVTSEVAQESRARKLKSRLTDKQKSEIEKVDSSLEKTYNELQKNINKIYAAQKKISLSPEQREFEKEQRDAGIKTRLSSIKELREAVSEYEDTSMQLGLVRYVNWAKNEIAGMRDILSKRKADGGFTEHNVIASMNWNSVFNTVTEIQRLLEKVDEETNLSEARKNIIKNVINSIEGERSQIKAMLLEWGRTHYLEKLIESDTQIRDEYRSQFGLDYDALNADGKMEMQRDEYIQQEMSANIDEIAQELQEYYAPMADEAVGHLGYVPMQLMSEVDMKSKDIQLISQMIRKADAMVRKSSAEEASRFDEMHNEYVEKFGSNRDMRKKYSGMIKTTESGKSYFTSKYNPEFRETMSEFERAAGDPELAEEKYGDKKLIDEKTRVYNSEAVGGNKVMVFGEGYSNIVVNGDEVTFEYYGESRTVTLAQAFAMSELNHWKYTNTKQEDIIDDFGDRVKIYWIPTDKWLDQDYVDMQKNNPEKFEELEKLKDQIRINDERYEERSSLIYNLYGNPDVEFMRLPGVTKSDVSRIQEGQTGTLIKHKVSELVKTQKDEFDVVATNIANEKVGSIPIPFRARLDAKDQSYDLHSMVLMDTVQSINYAEKKAIEDTLLVVVEVMKDKKYPMYNSRGEIMKGPDGRTIYHEGIPQEVLKAESIIENSLYGIKTKDAGVIRNKKGEVIAENQQIAKSALKWFSGVALMLNWANSVINASMGTISNVIEAVGGDVYNVRDYAKAQKRYYSDMAAIADDIGRNVVRSHTNRLMDAFNVMGNAEYLQNKFEVNSRVETLMNADTLRPIAKMGEHMMQAKVMYAVLESIKVQDKLGRYINSKGEVVTKKSDAATLADMITFEKKAQGVEMTLNPLVARTSFTPEGGTDQILFEAKNLIKSKIIELHGLYDSELQAHAQRHVLGKLGFFLRKWMIPGIMRRWRGASIKAFTSPFEEIPDNKRYYSAAQRMEKEGYYVTAIRLITAIGKDLVRGKMEIAKMSENWDKMSAMEKANIRKFVTDMGIILVSYLAYGLLDEDDEDLITSRYLIRRQISEMTFFFDVSEAYKIAQTPSAAMGNIRSLIQLADQAFTNPTERYKQGAREGELKLKRKFQKAIIPRWRNAEDFGNSLNFLDTF